MARKLRLEFPGAIYHVINRGNYRDFVFRSLGARQAFEGSEAEPKTSGQEGVLPKSPH